MTAIPVKDFDIEFIERTQKLIANYNGDTEFTLLLNCLLGMIIIPNQFNQKKHLKYLQKEIIDIPTIRECLESSLDFKFEPIKRIKGSKPAEYEPAKKTLKNLMKSIRNSLSHIETIEPINENGKWVGIVLTDKHQGSNEPIFKCNLKYEQILVVSEYISSEYQRLRLGIINPTDNKRRSRSCFLRQHDGCRRYVIYNLGRDLFTRSTRICHRIYI